MDERPTGRQEAFQTYLPRGESSDTCLAAPSTAPSVSASPGPASASDVPAYTAAPLAPIAAAFDLFGHSARLGRPRPGSGCPAGDT